MKRFKRNIIKLFFMSLLLVVSLVISSNMSLAYEKEVGRLSDIMIEIISNSGKQLVAVVDFNDSTGNITKLGRFLAEEFSCALSNNKRGFEVIERIQLKNIIEEHKLSLRGIIDLKTAQKIGEISGIEALVIGTITSLGDSVRLSVKLLDTRTAKIISSTRGHIPKTRAIEELLEKGIDKSPRPPSRRRKARPNTQPRKGTSVEAEGFTFTPVECTKSGGAFKCTVLFMNNSKADREIRIKDGHVSGDSSLTDNFGQKYCVKIKIGERGHGGYSFREVFVPGVPEQVDFFARNVNPKATKITAVISIREFSKLVVLKDIPITN